MKRFKKIPLLFLSTVCTLCLAVGFASCKGNNGTEGLKYEFDTTRRHCVAAGFEEDLLAREITIASKYMGYTVTEIGSSAFQHKTRLQSVIIPDSVTKIGSNAFWGCSSLKSIAIPDSVTKIGAGAFRDCESLQSITIPDSVTTIEAGAFEGCSSLENLVLSTNLTLIEEGAFEGCTSLEMVRVPDTVTAIEREAFFGCSSLSHISLPDYLLSIGDSVFENTAYYNDRTNWQDGILYYYGRYLIEADEEALSSVAVKDGTRLIADGAFCGATGVKNISIPDSVIAIGGNAFADCRLESITVNSGNTIYRSSGNCLINTDSKTLIKGCNHSAIPNDGSITVISDRAFYGCKDIAVRIPDGVTEIGDFAFSDCGKLERAVIPNSVKKIGEYAFSNCVSLTDITYYGSIEEWNKINKANGWDSSTNHYIVTCAYGQIEK